MRRVVATVVIAAAVVLALLALVPFAQQLDAEPLVAALQPMIERKDSDQSQVAQSLLASYLQTRRIASMWSGLYWGFAWASAILGALGGLILKIESPLITDDKIKKDTAAFLAMTAALLVTISTSGDFQRKWQANRTAAAEIERAAYDFLKNNGENPRGYFGTVGQALHKRHHAILGTGNTPQAASDAARAARGTN